ncbi:MAG: hypothetical protein OXI16_02845 [Chloroflexota bacterium]|nr:hypothetical protein [Chloroflexota bacterium]
MAQIGNGADGGGDRTLTISSTQSNMRCMEFIDFLFPPLSPHLISPKVFTKSGQMVTELSVFAIIDYERYFTT